MRHATEHYYREMLQRLSMAPSAWRSNPLCGFAALKGQHYEHALLVVGRATNGWSPQLNADELLQREAPERVFNELFAHEEMTWVTKCWGTEKGQSYNTKKSAFWRVIREVVRELSVADVEQASWPAYISWSNLYKVSPEKGGNPSGALRNAIFPACARILNAEVNTLLPRRILFLTGLWWVQPFLTELGFAQDSSMGYPVEAVGTIPNGARIAVLPHPQGKPEQQIVIAAATSLSKA